MAARQVTSPYQQAITTPPQRPTSYNPPQPPPKKGISTAAIVIIIIAVIVLLIGVGLVIYFLTKRKSTSGGGGSTNGNLNSSCSASNPCLQFFNCQSGICKSMLAGPCGKDSDCQVQNPQLVCSGSQCREVNGSSCTDDTQCASRLCGITSTCISCSNVFPCNTGMCQGGICVS